MSFATPHDPGATDSYGVPWSGRSLTTQPFAGDDGAADPGLARALAGRRDATIEDAAVVAALATARVMVAVVATVGEDHPVPLARGDHGADMSLVTLALPDGRRALPAFTESAAVTRWDARARPVPVEAARAALAAVAEGCDVLLLDPAGPVPFVVSRPAVWALAQGRRWVPAGEDPRLQGMLVELVTGIPDLEAARCHPGDRSELTLVLGVTAGLPPERVQRVIDSVNERLAASEVVAERVDSLELTVLPA